MFEKAGEWMPQRWLIDGDGGAEGEGEGGKEGARRLEEMKRWFWAFNKGSRSCIGKDFTLVGTCAVYPIVSYLHPTAVPPLLSLSLFFFLFLFFQLTTTETTVMKLIIYTIYSRYSTSIVDEGNMEMTDKFLAQPEGKRLVLEFTKVR